MPIASPLLPTTRLQQRQAFQVRGRRGERIECRRGELWVTQDGDPRDVVLSAGQCFTLDRAGTAVISALKDAEFVYRRPGQPAHGADHHMATPAMKDCVPAY